MALIEQETANFARRFGVMVYVNLSNHIPGENPQLSTEQVAAQVEAFMESLPRMEISGLATENMECDICEEAENPVRLA